jgi:phage shock protein PspC (stress-responsive transcriptional regulator)
MIKSILDYFEKRAFGVFTWWGEKLGVKSHSIRLFFIYLSFLTFGSPLIIYLIMVFILQNKNYFKPPSRKTIWEI